MQVIFYFLWDHWAHPGYFENGIPLKSALRGICSLANHSVAYEETQSNRFSDFRDFVCSLFPKAILFYFYFSGEIRKISILFYWKQDSRAHLNRCLMAMGRERGREYCWIKLWTNIYIIILNINQSHHKVWKIWALSLNIKIPSWWLLPRGLLSLGPISKIMIPTRIAPRPWCHVLSLLTISWFKFMYDILYSQSLIVGLWHQGRKSPRWISAVDEVRQAVSSRWPLVH